MSTGISTGPNLLQSEVENPDASLRYGSVNTRLPTSRCPTPTRSPRRRR